MDQGGSSSYVEMFYEAHVENGLINGFFAASVYIIVCMTMDRYKIERVFVIGFNRFNLVLTLNQFCETQTTITYNTELQSMQL